MDNSNTFSGNIFVIFIFSIPIPAGPWKRLFQKLCSSKLHVAWFNPNQAFLLTSEAFALKDFGPKLIDMYKAKPKI